jgi:WD40 repeat protein
MGCRRRERHLWSLEARDVVLHVAMSADGHLGASISENGTLCWWDLGSGRLVRTSEAHADRATGMALSADGRCALSASADGTIKVWDLQGPGPPAVFFCEGAASCCAFAGPQHVVAGDEAGRLHYLEIVS